jgi:hypothetical protein
VCSNAKLQCQTYVAASRNLGLSEQPPNGCQLPLVLRNLALLEGGLALDEGKSGQHRQHYRRHHSGDPEAALAASGGAATGQDQLRLSRRGGRLTTGLIGQPGLGFFQLAAAQQQAAVTAADFSLPRPGEQTGVQVDSGDVGVQNFDQPVDTDLEVDAV